MTKIYILGLGILSVLFESLAEINTAYLSSLERGSTGPGPGWSVIAYFQIHQHSELEWPGLLALVQLQASVALALESCRIADHRFFFCKFSATFTSHSNLSVSCLSCKSPSSRACRGLRRWSRGRGPRGPPGSPTVSWFHYTHCWIHQWHDKPPCHDDVQYRLHTVCLLTSRYYATIGWCGECSISIAWHDAGAGPGAGEL